MASPQDKRRNRNKITKENSLDLNLKRSLLGVPSTQN